MKSSFHKIQKEANKLLLTRRHKRDDKGFIIVDMVVKNDDGFLSVYSTNETPVISTDVAEFIENSTRSIAPREALVLHIHSDCIDEREKKEYAAAIKEYYAERYVESKKERRFNNIMIALLSLAGIITLVFAFHIDNAVWSEVIDIAAWVLLWEAVDIGVFKNRKINLDRLRYLAYMSMKVDYYPLEKDKQKGRWDIK